MVTSRPNHDAVAARAPRVGRAAAIEIEDLTLEQAEQYLHLSTSRSRVAEWEAVFQQLRTAPEDAASRNLTAVLATPLMVMLARTLYNDTDEHDPRELLDTGRFATDKELKRYLLSGYVDAVYAPGRRTRQPSEAARPAWDHEQARHWLGFLATGLRGRGTHDVAWWQLPNLLARQTRILVTTAIAGLMVGLVSGLTSRLAAGFVVGFAPGLAVGPVVGLFNEAGFARGRAGREPERLRPYWRRRGRHRRPFTRASLTRAASEFTNGLAAGLSVGLAAGLAAGLVIGLAGGRGSAPGLSVGLAVGPVAGVVIGVMNIVVSVLGEGHDPHESDPWQLLSTDRTVTLIRMSTTGIVMVPLIFLIYTKPTFGLVNGLSLVVSVGLLRLTRSAWGHWLLFARLWLPLTGRLPWRPQRFLEDAHHRGILRRTGAAYQFRHAELRDHLAEHHPSKPTKK